MDRTIFAEGVSKWLKAEGIRLKEERWCGVPIPRTSRPEPLACSGVRHFSIHENLTLIRLRRIDFEILAHRDG
jgi:hypothetical protein